MSPPEVKKKVSLRKKRNYIAKALATPKFKQKVIPNKRKDTDPLDDYTLVDQWITREE